MSWRTLFYLNFLCIYDFISLVFISDGCLILVEKHKIQAIISLLSGTHNADMRKNPSQEGGSDGGPSNHHILEESFYFSLALKICR